VSVKLVVNIGFDEVCIHNRCKEAVVFLEAFESISESIWQFRDTSLFQFISCQFKEVFVEWPSIPAIISTVKARYGHAVESGNRVSILVDFSPAP